jgi:mannose-6-phosphate isomerase-like protein (cupin superfamily)
VKISSTLKVINHEGIEEKPGVINEQKLKKLVGCPDSIPTDRIRVALASYKPGALEALHWHPIEAFYFVLSGHAVVRDIENNEVEVGPGSAIYAPPGIAGAHEWEAKDALQILSVRASPETDKKLQFTVDKETKRSFVDLSDLAKRDAISFKSHY